MHACMPGCARDGGGVSALHAKKARYTAGHATQGGALPARRDAAARRKVPLRRAVACVLACAHAAASGGARCRRPGMRWLLCCASARRHGLQYHPCHAFTQVIAATSNVAKHLHMPAQSGSSAVLERMRRCASARRGARHAPSVQKHRGRPQTKHAARACWQHSFMPHALPPSRALLLTRPAPDDLEFPAATRARRTTRWLRARGRPSPASRCQLI